uniref:Protein phosphatase 1 regulatory subunit 3G n=1 Tax=Latimeria chalumnae TaxID=7897 RepID=H3B3E9_LATCH
MLRRRTKSLPNTPTQAAAAAGILHALSQSYKKKVKFADSLGFDLASVKHYSAAEEPHIPPKVLSRLQSFPPCSLDQLGDRLSALSLQSLAPGFAQPGEADSFLERVRLHKVCLERIDTSHLDIRGLVRVWDVSYKKEVTIRYTFNNWLSFIDTPARYIPRSERDAQTDQFAFTLCIPPFIEKGSSVHFAICFRTEKDEFWDNNNGQNYTVRHQGPPMELPQRLNFSWCWFA